MSPGGGTPSPSSPAEDRPAQVLLPRPAGRGGHLVRLLEGDGFEVVHAPFIELESEGGPALRELVADLAAGIADLLVITSPAAVHALQAVGGTGGNTDDRTDAPPSPRVAVAARTRTVAVGETSAAALRAAGVDVDVVAAGSGVALVDALPSAEEFARTFPPRTDPVGHEPAAPAHTHPAPEAPQVLFPASSAAAPTISEGLRATGYRVRQVTAYRPRPTDVPASTLHALAHGDFAVIVLTSSMIARRAAELDIHPATRVVTIGRPTTHAATEAGLAVAAVAEHPDDESLARAVRTVWKEGTP